MLCQSYHSYPIIKFPPFLFQLNGAKANAILTPQGLALPSIYAMLQRYVSPTLQSTSVATITAACYLGSLISNFAAPAIISQYDWQAVFYLFAVLPPLLWLPFWTRTFLLRAQETSEVRLLPLLLVFYCIA